MYDLQCIDRCPHHERFNTWLQPVTTSMKGFNIQQVQGLVVCRVSVLKETASVRLGIE